jgi:hypothetical protein
MAAGVGEFAHIPAIHWRDQNRLDMAPRVGVLSFPLTWLEGQRQFGYATGDVETPVTFDAERLQRD